MLIFADSFDYYTVVGSKWITGNGGIDLSGTQSRTGPGCMLIPSGIGDTGPYIAFPAIGEIIVGGAIYPDGVCEPFRLLNIAGAGLYIENIRISVQADMSVGWDRGGPGGYFLMGQSVPNVCIQNAYNYIEARVLFSTTNTGTVEIRVNGLTVFSVTGVKTTGLYVGTAFCDAVQLGGGAGTIVTRHDDFYVLDPSAPPNDSFLGPVRIYACLPWQDSAPLDWTPSVAGAHFPLVNSIPPNLTKWVESNTVGQQDQYRHDTSAIPPTIQVLGVQHCLLAALDAPGARGIASVVDGIVGPNTAALSTSPAQYRTEYDVDPVTGVAWTLPLITSPRVFGPAVTV